MSDTIKCNCTHCGAKYRLPIEAQGRIARCKRCGEKFSVPTANSELEDSILAWLTEPNEEEEALAQPRVISMPADAASTDATRKARGPIRMKTGSSDAP